MVRGKNNCKLEENILAGVPDFFYPENYQLYNPDDFVWKENPVSVKNRKNIDTQLTITGGGIDPTTGYTRRVMVTKPWLSINRPINLKDLPNWSNFIAGIDAKKPTRYNYQKKIRSKYHGNKYNNISAIITLITIVILLILLLVIFIRKK